VRKEQLGLIEKVKSMGEIVQEFTKGTSEGEENIPLAGTSNRKKVQTHKREQTREGIREDRERVKKMLARILGGKRPEGAKKGMDREAGRDPEKVTDQII